MAKNSFHNFQNWGTIVALIISVLALVVSVYETNLMAEQQRATVWPYLYIIKNFKEDRFQLQLENNGTGPAIIESVEVSYHGQLVEDYFELLELFQPGHQVDSSTLRFSRLSEQVIRSGASRSIFEAYWSEEFIEMLEQFNEVDIKINYCSVLNECWVYDFQTNQRREGKFRARKEFDS
ncbi:MAG: hypothetical protein AAF433_17475 [Bacteroidota bacterium]